MVFFFELIINIIYAISRPLLSMNVLIFIVTTTGCYLVSQAVLLDGIDYGYLWDLDSITIGSAITIFGFSFGLLLHRLWLKQKTVNKSTKYSIYLLLFASMPLSFINTNKLNGLVDCLSILIIFPFCVYWGAKTNPKKKSLSIFELLGIISYPIYLFHVSLGSGISKILKSTGCDLQHYATFSGFLLVAVLLAISLFLDRFYDQPVRRYLSSIIIKWTDTPSNKPPLIPKK